MDSITEPLVSTPLPCPIPPQGYQSLFYQYPIQTQFPRQIPAPRHHSYASRQPYHNDMLRYPGTSGNDSYAAASSASLQKPPNSMTQAVYPRLAPAPPLCDRRPEQDMPPPAGHYSPSGSKPPADGYIPKEPVVYARVQSQGRRGILPSVPGQAAAIATNGANGSMKRNADGKFPCPHCEKRYLHSKHLKRHLLRHTGDRPYMCVLCHVTFSRSDILKRHFEKCSLRRGNPTGVSHLSHPHAHVKRARAAGVVPVPVQ